MTLEEFRVAAGLSFEALGAAIGVGDEAARLYCRGKRSPRPSVMKRVIEFTKGKVTADSFYEAELAAEQDRTDEGDAPEDAAA